MWISLRGCSASGCPQIAPLKGPPFIVSLRIVGLDIALIERAVLMIPDVIVRATRVKQQNIMQATKVLTTLLCIVVRSLTFPHNFVDKVIFAKNLVEHDLNVMRSVPIAVIV